MRRGQSPGLPASSPGLLLLALRSPLLSQRPKPRGLMLGGQDEEGGALPGPFPQDFCRAWRRELPTSSSES